MHADHLYRWPLIVLFFYSTLVDFVHTILVVPVPRTYWFDISCLEAEFGVSQIAESVKIAAAGAVRLLNENDPYQAFIYQKLFGRARDTRVIGGSSNSETWSVVEIEAWIGSMQWQNRRELADVRIYCDDDARWTLVPDDEASVVDGLPVNSQRTFGISQEWEDTVNYMRRDPTNEGCRGADTLGVTYTTPIPYDPNSRGTRVPEDYHSFRQTITICDISLMSHYRSLDNLNLVNTEDYDDFEIFELESARTVVLFHQFLQLNNYRLRSNVDPAASAAEWGAAEDSWNAVITRPPTGLGFVQRPGPYLWNAIFAYLANNGYALRQDLSQEEYDIGVGLLDYEEGLKNTAFRRPPILPNSIYLPPWLRSWRNGR